MTHASKRRLLALGLCLALLGTAGAAASELDTGAVYCFSAGDFQNPGLGNLTGACITGVPAGFGQVRLGSRTVRAGDILTAAQLEKLTFAAGDAQGEAVMTFLPIYGTRVEPECSLTFSIRKKEDLPPVAEDLSMETYKNLSNQGQLKAADPEGESVTFELLEEPRRGTVSLEPDGSFTYSPKKNKVGTDRFTFIAKDPAGQVSNTATVTVEILKPLDSAAYGDLTAGQFEAMWMRDSGLFTGTAVAGQSAFGPEEKVSRGDFLAMVMKLFEIPLEDEPVSSGFADEDQAPDWLLPYLSAAMRLGVASGSVGADGPVFRANDPITGAEAAVMLQNVLLLPRGGDCENVPAWAETAVSALAAAGIQVEAPNAPITRTQAAQLLYNASRLAETAPGLEVFKRN